MTSQKCQNHIIGQQCPDCHCWINDMSEEEYKALMDEKSQTSLPPGFMR